MSCPTVLHRTTALASRNSLWGALQVGKQCQNAATGEWARPDAAVNCGNCLSEAAELLSAEEQVDPLVGSVACYEAALSLEPDAVVRSLCSACVHVTTCRPVLPAISSFSLSETQKIVLNIRNMSICTGTLVYILPAGPCPCHPLSDYGLFWCPACVDVACPVRTDALCALGRACMRACIIAAVMSVSLSVSLRFMCCLGIRPVLHS